MWRNALKIIHLPSLLLAPSRLSIWCFTREIRSSYIYFSLLLHIFIVANVLIRTVYFPNLNALVSVFSRTIVPQKNIAKYVYIFSYNKIVEISICMYLNDKKIQTIFYFITKNYWEKSCAPYIFSKLNFFSMKKYEKV